MSPTTKSGNLFFLDLLRAFAILLVVNSHMDQLYPISHLATGGLFGNQLFFFVSGYGIYLGLMRKNEPFFPWIKRRLLRIYEPLFIIATFLVFMGEFKINNFKSFFDLYIVSKAFWFLPAIMASYLPLYWVIRKDFSRKAFHILFSLVGLAYGVTYIFFLDKSFWNTEVFLPFKVIYYFATMLFGVYAARYLPEIKGSMKDIVFLFLATIFFYGFLGGLVKFGYYSIQIFDHVFSFAWLVFIFRVVKAPFVATFFQNNFASVVAYLSKTTLQIYLLHEFVVKSPIVENCVFPVNVIIFISATLSLALVFEQISFSKFLAKSRDPR